MSGAKAPRLVWKWEDGPPDAVDNTDQDVGPAWLDDKPVNGGEWITRAEARRLAEENGYEVVWDDGSG